MNILKGDSFLKTIKAETEDFNPKRIIIDSLTTLTDSMLVTDLKEDVAFSVVQVAESVNPIPRTDRLVAKTILYHLIDALRSINNATVVMTSELLEGEPGLSGDQVSEFITDGVIVLRANAMADMLNRTMEIKKMRYTNMDGGVHSYEIVANGITVE